MTSCVRRAALGGLVAIALLVPQAPGRAAFPGRNGRIVMAGCKICYENDDPELFSVRPDGSRMKRLTQNARWDTSPEYSPDGRRIVFDCHGGYRAQSRSREICVMDADGSNRSMLTDNDVPDLDPSWSPDGTQIVFKRNWNDPELFVMNADGSDEHPITDNDFDEFAPAWSPDGGLIAFMTFRDNSQEIFVIAPDGTGEANLTNTPDLQEDSPAWAPDGQKLAYNRYTDAAGPVGGWNVFTMARDGSDQTRLVHGFTGDWSPDGRWIVFNDENIYKIHPDGTGKTLLLKSPKRGWNLGAASWQSR
jgi:Tol biopolymer transport system component